MDWNLHPIIFLKELNKQYGNVLVVTFSIYEYKPLSLEDKRKNFSTNIEDVDANYIIKILNDLNLEEELSINSIVYKNENLFHIPMIDFTGNLTREKLLTIKKVLPNHFLDKLHLFDSGKSYHGYISVLFSEREWINFMGTLLLLNYPNQEPIVDQRWIGHRLRGGCASLRWSSKSRSNNFFPEYVGSFFDLLEKEHEPFI